MTTEMVRPIFVVLLALCCVLMVSAAPRNDDQLQEVVKEQNMDSHPSRIRRAVTTRKPKTTTKKKAIKYNPRTLTYLKFKSILERMLPQVDNVYEDIADYYDALYDYYFDYNPEYDYYNSDAELLPNYRYYYANSAPASLLYQYLSAMSMKNQWMTGNYLWRP